MLHSLLLTVLLVQLSSSQSTLLPLKQSNLLAVLHAPLVVLNGLPIILQIVVLNGLEDNLYSDSVCGYGRKSYNSGDDMCRLCCEFTLSAPWHQTLLPNWVIGVIDADTDSAEQPVQSLLVDHSVHSVHRVVAGALQGCTFCLS